MMALVVTDPGETMKIRMTFAVDNKSTPLPIEGFNQGLFARNYNVTPERQAISSSCFRRSGSSPEIAPSSKSMSSSNWLEELQQRVPVK